MDFADAAIWKDNVSGRIHPVVRLPGVGWILIHLLAGIENGFPVSVADTLLSTLNFNDFSTGTPDPVCSNEF